MQGTSKRTFSRIDSIKRLNEMIAKLTTGNGFSGALKYDLRDGTLMAMKGTLPEQIRVLDAKDVCFDYDDDGSMVLDVKQVAWDFRQQAIAYSGAKPIEKPVYHWALSYHPDDIVTDEQMLKDTEEFLERMGFGNTQYVVTAHRDRENPHVHIIANIVDNDAKRISTYKMIEKSHKVAADITKKRGYIWGENVTKKAIENAHKPHEKVRYLVESLVKDAVDKAHRIEEIPTLLEHHNVECIIKHSSDGKPVGISFSTIHDEQLYKFRGSQLDRNLSAGNIMKSIDARLAQEEVDLLPSAKIVERFSCNYQDFRIIKSSGLYKLQQLEWNRQKINTNGRYFEKNWQTKAEFSAFKKLGKDADGHYFIIKNKEGKASYINQYGVKLPFKKIQKLTNNKVKL